MTNIVKWISSLIIIVSMILTASNIYPLNIFLAVPATIGWIYVSFKWGDKAMISMNFVALTIYLLGIINFIHK
jgi:hypothetical protein